MIESTRIELSSEGLFCGAQAIRWELEDRGIVSPSTRTINRILNRLDLVDRPSDGYLSKGRKYPALNGSTANRVHQADFVGPLYLKGPLRFYSLNSIDLATRRCAIEPMIQRAGQNTVDAFWAIWQRLGLPDHQQVDNEWLFFGSPQHPRGMGILIRLCLYYNVELWFIPPSEPWRNGVVEGFNDHYQKKFLARTRIEPDESDLRDQTYRFESKHNSRWRYDAIKGLTPLSALTASGKQLRFPGEEAPPRHPIPKPEQGKYHFVRFIRSDGILTIFKETFDVPSEAIYEYIVATVDVETQTMTLSLDGKQIDEWDYTTR